MNYIPCKCGCGTQIRAIDRKGRSRQYVNGHCRKGQRTPLLQRLLNLIEVTPSGCWRWLGHVNPNGYGTFNVYNHDVRGAHRVSYELHYGKITDGQYVCHTCDNKACVNPMHLWLGSQKQNIADMRSKGRQRHSRLTMAQVEAIRSDAGTLRSVAAKYGISAGHVSKIRSGWTPERAKSKLTAATSGREDGGE